MLGEIYYYYIYIYYILLLLVFVNPENLISRWRFNNQATMETDVFTFTEILTPEAANIWPWYTKSVCSINSLRPSDAYMRR